MNLQAVKPFRYAGKALEAGDQFQATRKHARILTAINKAREVLEKTPDSAPDIPPITTEKPADQPAKVKSAGKNNSTKSHSPEA